MYEIENGREKGMKKLIIDFLRNISHLSFFLLLGGRKEGREGGTHRYLDIDGILILFFIFFSLFFCSSQTWTAETNGGSWDWHSIASSSLGIKLIVVDNNGGYGGYLYTSTDSGRHELHD